MWHPNIYEVCIVTYLLFEIDFYLKIIFIVPLNCWYEVCVWLEVTNLCPCHPNTDHMNFSWSRFGLIYASSIISSSGDEFQWLFDLLCEIIGVCIHLYCKCSLAHVKNFFSTRFFLLLVYHWFGIVAYLLKRDSFCGRQWLLVILAWKLRNQGHIQLCKQRDRVMWIGNCQKHLFSFRPYVTSYHHHDVNISGN